MKKAIILFAVASAAFAQTRSTSSKKKAQSAPAPQAVTIPKDAVANPDGTTYTWTDKAGKKWIYAKTPFGIMKSAASENTNPGAASTDAAMTKVIDKGDSVRFERQGPFGPITWEKKKTELNESEQGIINAQKANQQ